jgi:putative copper resistance protein D
LSGSPDLVQAALRWVEYLGLLGAIGTIVVRRLAGQRPPIDWARHPPMHVALGAAFAGGLALVAIQGFEAGALPGWERLARVAAEGLAFLFCVRGFGYPVPLGLLAAALLSVAGHAIAAPQAAGAVFADVVHVLSAGMWAGGILALAALHPPAGWRSEEARAVLDRFGGVALIAFAVTALSGVLRASDQLRDISDLWTTYYGIVLSLKSIGVVVMLVLSALAWRRGVPLARAEAAVAVLVVAATALLAAFPMPG